MTEVLLDTIQDAVKMLPFLFAAYLLMEYVEHKSSEKLAAVLGSSRYGAIGGAILGCVPQCGFSVTAANLYAGRVITLGTLVAVFLSTSDEAIPVLLAHPDRYGVIVQLLFIKLVVAVAVGLIVDLLIRKNKRAEQKEYFHHLCSHCDCEHGIVKPALRHTLSIFLFILILSLLLNLAIFWIGEDRLSVLLMQGSMFQPVVAGIIGLIPNCASSVLLTELYLSGSISFGSAVAGLCTGAGIGLAVLLRVNRHAKENLMIVAILYFAGVLCGLLLQLMGG